MSKEYIWGWRMAQKYVVLRDLAAGSSPIVTRSAGPMDFSTGTFAGEESDPKLEVHSLDEKQVAELGKETDVRGIAPEMPTALIEPFAAEASEADEAWGLGAVEAKSCPYTGRGVTVAVLDTGIDSEHVAFGGVTIVAKDFTGSESATAPDNKGHGTHCAGTIFGRDVRGKRIGVAPGIDHVFIGKVLADNGRGTSEMIFAGLKWAIERKAHVISMSLGFDFATSVRRKTDANWPLELAVSNSLEAYRANLRMFDTLMQMVRASAAWGHEPVIVAAAGNESKIEQKPDYKIAASLPAAAEGVISVSALRPSAGSPGLFELAPFSNIYPQVSGPGVNILSAKRGSGDQLTALSGTSMACPHVAGVAALWWEALRMTGGGTPTGKLVTAKLRATARANVFVPNLTAADRGDGLVTAPR
jgi:subtilisin family serine protease